MGTRKNWGHRPWEITFTPARKELPATVDYAVIGGGFTGLASAAWLKILAPQKSVLLLEAETLGAGSSGHTGGVALAESAVGDLPGLGDVLAGYQSILKQLEVEGDLVLPGVYELGRSDAMRNSPILWRDSGDLCAVKDVPGGSVDPGKVVSGLARAADRAGALVFEHAPVNELKFSKTITLCSSAGTVQAHKALFATNAFALDLNGMKDLAQPAFTSAVMTEALPEDTLTKIGLGERKPFYTIDLPYLWGRLLGNAVIFGSGLVFFENSEGLHSLDIDEGETLELFDRLQKRIARLHPALKYVNFTHRWGGPICIPEDWKPVFRRHPNSENVIVLGGFSGHGVAQSVYLGAWAAEVLLQRRELPDWR
ncbi:MAG TPA: FAD-dependent oxidoreductase [Verrucomicrobiae bacterium]|nr:FAD-dependent oxidoreductase [Verrucomicrobiae bacterium]